jgi:bacteriorhodopsin
MIYASTQLSWLAQLATGALDTWGLTIPLDPMKGLSILKELLVVELGVQSIEFIFYTWLLINFNKIKNITPYRYFDWFITTPTMLVSLMAFLSIDPENPKTLTEFIFENSKTVFVVVALNILMLFSGYLSEIKPQSQMLYAFVGFIPFIAYFYIIYEKFIKGNEKTNDVVDSFFTKNAVYTYFVVFWSLYGLAAFMPYVLKNTSYNILDIFSKNILGVFLVMIIWRNRNQKPNL